MYCVTFFKKTYQIPIDKYILSNSPKFIRSYSKDGGQCDDRYVSFWVMVLVMVVGWGTGVSYLYSRLRDGNGCAARTMEAECLMPFKLHTKFNIITKEWYTNIPK